MTPERFREAADKVARRGDEVSAETAYLLRRCAAIEDVGALPFHTLRIIWAAGDVADAILRGES